jgi:MerR family copper efflux transcriptional regulator
MNARLSIGFVARQTGCTVPTIRYYEEIGLLPPAGRTEAGQRTFDERTVRRLAFIRRCRDFGFSVDQVRELTGLVDEPGRPCAEVRDIAAAHLAEVRRKLDELKTLEASLNAFVCSCESACMGGPVTDCSILEDLAVPAERAGGAVSCCASGGVGAAG